MRYLMPNLAPIGLSLCFYHRYVDLWQYCRRYSEAAVDQPTSVIS